MDSTVIAVQQRLQALGFESVSGDVETIGFYAKLIFDEITTNINWPSIPDKLYYVYIDMICGEYLYKLYQTGRLDGFLPEDKSESYTLTSVGAGNVSYGFNGPKTKAQTLEELIDSLRNPRNKRYLFDFFRRLL